MKTIALVACSKKKLGYPAPAKDLYQGALFKKARAWAEANADEWYILSAEHGLVFPDQVLEPYDRTLPAHRYDWTTMVIGQLRWRSSLYRLAHNEKFKVVFLASERYRKTIAYILNLTKNVWVVTPLAGLPIGRQLQWLDQQTNL